MKSTLGEQLWFRRRVLASELTGGHGGEIVTESGICGTVGGLVVGRHLVDSLPAHSINYLVFVERPRWLRGANKHFQYPENPLAPGQTERDGITKF